MSGTILCVVQSFNAQYMVQLDCKSALRSEPFASRMTQSETQSVLSAVLVDIHTSVTRGVHRS